MSILARYAGVVRPDDSLNAYSISVVETSAVELLAGAIAVSVLFFMICFYLADKNVFLACKNVGRSVTALHPSHASEWLT